MTVTHRCEHPPRSLKPAKSDDWFRCVCGEYVHRREVKR